ncbi:glycosyltransferase family 4 protein [Corynebacterium sp. HMSC067D03]|uniref:glycosyltransferase family 4 protein n=2 Tax=unclassified Corynebacterium TaxID=2624378 RepID=UPI00114CDF3C|nr:glycosyltransferase family 4 protein [Corynebacterium sp. HMSC067D03]
MKNNIFFFVRTIRYLCSAAMHMFWSNPKHFKAQVKERLRQTDKRWLWRMGGDTKGNSTRSEFEFLVSIGELSRALTIDDSSFIERRRVIEQINLLAMEPATGGPGEKRSDSRILAFVTNSLPHTLSGYSVRSQHVFEAIAGAGIEVFAATRLGYPLNVGKIARSHQELVSSIKYFRLIPKKHNASLSIRLNEEVDLLTRLAEETHPSVLYTTTDFRNALVVSRVADRLGIPWIYEVRGEPEKTWLTRVPVGFKERAKNSEYYSKRRALETKAMLASNAVTTLSEVSKKSLVERGVPASKIWVVPNCVDGSLLENTICNESAREKLGLPEGKWVGTVTSVVEYEGLDTLLDAILYLPSDINILIVGDGVALPSLQRKAQEMRINHRVRFVGRKPRDEIQDWYAALDLFVVPRKNLEVCRTVTPIKAMEAMAMGIPVVASDLPAIREVTGDCAEYFRPEDPRSLAKAIETALVDRSLVSRGREWASSRTWDHAAVIYQELLTHLMDAGR